MSSSLRGKVAFITGAARGQGRSHALRLAEAGADMILLDRAAPLDVVDGPMPTPEDLAETARLVEQVGRRAVFGQADVRDVEAMRDVVDLGVRELGSVDVVVANAGVFWPSVSGLDIPTEQWEEVMAINATGVFNTIRAGAPSMIQAGRGGSIILTSSVAGVRGQRTMADYTASKHAVVGLMRAFANDLAQYGIRVNTVNPTGVQTAMIANPAIDAWYDAHPDTRDSAASNLLPVAAIEPRDVSEAVLWLASDASRYVTGQTLLVDAGLNVKL
jgi:SDR family mycofactocin-dependent oxidoreductase